MVHHTHAPPATLSSFSRQRSGPGTSLTRSPPLLSGFHPSEQYLAWFSPLPGWGGGVRGKEGDVNIALSIGHHPTARGCNTIDGRWTEYEFWRHCLTTLADQLERMMGHKVYIVNRYDAGGSTPSYAAAACNATLADLAIEFHFNASDSRAASGTETFYWYNSARGKIAAEMIQHAMVEVLKLPDRGIKGVGRPSDNAYEFFHRTRMPAILVEPSFAASNVTDNDRLQTRIGDLIDALTIAIDAYATATGQ